MATVAVASTSAPECPISHSKSDSLVGASRCPFSSRSPNQPPSRNAYLPTAYDLPPDHPSKPTPALSSEPNASATPTLHLSAHHADFDEPTRAIHSAFASFTPVSPQFAMLPIADAFNWSSLKLPLHVQRTWYGVAFRSLRSPTSAPLSPALYLADALAHQEAKDSGGLVVYWYGSPDPVTGENLATCVWCSRAEARKANTGVRHLEAVKYAKDAYEHYDLERYVVRKVAGEEGVRIEEYTGGEVGL